MLSAYDFRYMYDNGKLPVLNKTPIANHTNNDNTKISQEWNNIDKKLTKIAKTFMKNKKLRSYPPCFYITVKYSENVSRLREELHFNVSRSPGIYSFDTHTYCLEF